MGALQRAASSITREPAATSVSLLASAMVLPARMADKVGRSPLNPTMAATTTSTSGACTRSQAAWMPRCTWTLCGRASRTSWNLAGLQITTCGTRKASACSMSSCALELALIINTEKRSGC